MSRAVLEHAPTPRADLSSRAELRALHEFCFGTLDRSEAASTLFSLGYVEGRADALQVLAGFLGERPPEARFSGPGLGLLMEPEEMALKPPFRGTLNSSVEAELHVEALNADDAAVCFASAGYASGWYGGLFSQSILIRERHCSAHGAAACTFDGRLAAPDKLISVGTGLEALVCLAELNDRAESLLTDADCEGPMLGRFDPLSPAAHIWGPVMILPYSGQEDSIDALISAESDLGAERVRVVVLDLTGVQLEALEADGLSRLLDLATGMGIEPVIVGLNASEIPGVGEQPSLALPVCVHELVHGIAIGFQLARFGKNV